MRPFIDAEREFVQLRAAGDHEGAVRVLESVLRAVTYNNMGCFYKSMTKLHTALQYLRKAQKIEERCGDRCQNPAGTHLTLCALLSQMGKHMEALQHAERALKLLEAAPPPAEGSGTQSESLVSVAYFNMGAEFEHLKKPKEAE